MANLACVAASPTELARELPDVADRVSVILPWGELFRAVVTPEHATLAAIAHLCQKDAFFEIVFSYDPARDAGAAVLPARYELSATELRAHLDGDYRRAGLNFAGVQLVDQRALLAYPTTWAKRLAHGRPRRVWRIWGVKA